MKLIEEIHYANINTVERKLLKEPMIEQVREETFQKVTLRTTFPSYRFDDLGISVLLRSNFPRLPGRINQELRSG